VSTRRVDEIAQAMGLSGISKKNDRFERVHPAERILLVNIQEDAEV
jgi:hypothetical protein